MISLERPFVGVTVTALAIFLTGGSFCAAQVRRVDEFGDSIPQGAFMRFGTVRLRIIQGTMSLAFSEEGNHLISTDYSPLVRFWDIETGAEVRRIDLGATPDAAILTPDGSHLIVNRLSGLSMLQTPSGKVVFSNDAKQNNNRNFALSRDSLLLASFPRDSLQLWDTATGDLLLSLNERAVAAQFSPSGQFLAIASDRDGVIHVWDLYAGRVRCELKPKGKCRWESILFVDESMVIGYGMVTRRNEAGRAISHSNIEQWTLADPTVSTMFGLEGEDLLGGGAMVLSRDGSRLMTSHHEKLVLWDVMTHKPLRNIDGTANIRAIAISPDNRTLAAGGFEHKLALWNLETGNEEIPQPDSHHGGVLSVQESPGGSTLLTTGEEGTTRQWDTSTGEHLRLLHRNGGWTRDLAFLPDGKQAALCGEFSDGESPGFKGRVAIIDLSNGDTLREWTVDGRAMKLAPSSDGTRLAIGIGLGMAGLFGGEAPPEIQVWDLAKNQAVASLKGVKDEITSIEYAGENEIRFTTASGGYVWDTTQAEARELYLHSRTSTPMGDSTRSVDIRILQDGQRLLSSTSIYSRTKRSSRGCIQLATQGDAKIIWSHEFADGVPSQLVISPDKKIVATYFRRTVNPEELSSLVLLNMETGDEIQSFGLDGEHIRSISFSRNGRTIYTGMDRGDILSWDIASVYAATQAEK